jgi:hypothetical protein
MVHSLFSVDVMDEAAIGRGVPSLLINLKVFEYTTVHMNG